MARKLKPHGDVSNHEHLSLEGGSSMPEQKRGDQEKMRPEHQEQGDRTTRREENDQNEQGGGTQRSPNNPQRKQGS
jgi:hypothetical protein